MSGSRLWNWTRGHRARIRRPSGSRLRENLLPSVIHFFLSRRTEALRDMDGPQRLKPRFLGRPDRKSCTSPKLWRAFR